MTSSPAVFDLVTIAGGFAGDSLAGGVDPGPASLSRPSRTLAGYWAQSSSRAKLSRRLCSAVHLSESLHSRFPISDQWSAIPALGSSAAGVRGPPGVALPGALFARRRHCLTCRSECLSRAESGERQSDPCRNWLLG